LDTDYTVTTPGATTFQFTIVGVGPSDGTYNTVDIDNGTATLSATGTATYTASREVVIGEIFGVNGLSDPTLDGDYTVILPTTGPPKTFTFTNIGMNSETTLDSLTTSALATLSATGIATTSAPADAVAVLAGEIFNVEGFLAPDVSLNGLYTVTAPGATTFTFTNIGMTASLPSTTTPTPASAATLSRRGTLTWTTASRSILAGEDIDVLGITPNESLNTTYTAVSSNTASSTIFTTATAVEAVALSGLGGTPQGAAQFAQAGTATYTPATPATRAVETGEIFTVSGATPASLDTTYTVTAGGGSTFTFTTLGVIEIPLEAPEIGLTVAAEVNFGIYNDPATTSGVTLASNVSNSGYYTDGTTSNVSTFGVYNDTFPAVTASSTTTPHDYNISVKFK
jgi:hypothetical protein